MKKIIFYFLALLLAVWLGIFMSNHPGYVLISSGGLSIETSLWFFIVVLILLFFVIYFLLRLGGGTSRVALSLKNWIGNHRKSKAYEQTVLGLYDLIEGDWKGAEKKLARFAKHSDMVLVNYLAAALMAERQGAFERRDKYLLLAQKAGKDRPLTVNLAEAILKVGNGEWDKAQPVLEKLNKSYPKNSFVLDLLQKVYVELEDWYGLKKILPSLRKQRVLEKDEVDHLEDVVYGGLLLEGEQGNRIDDVWNNLSRDLKKRPYLLAIYSEYLLHNEKDKEAEDLLKMVARKNLDGRLLNLYAEIKSADPIKHLMRAEEWLKRNSDNVSLLICLSRICRRQKLWGKARHYLEESIKIEPTSGAFIDLAELMAEQNDLKSAVEFYEKAVG